MHLYIRVVLVTGEKESIGFLFTKIWACPRYTSYFALGMGIRTTRRRREKVGFV